MNVQDIKSKISVLQGDITTIGIDAIVNAANSTLLGGGGVDGAIHRAGGPKILEECKEIVAREGNCKTGDAVITNGGNLPAKYVIHTVGPVWQGGNKEEAEKLSNCYRNSLELAVKHGVSSVAFPNISTGVFGFPKEEAAKIAVETVNSFLAEDQHIEKVLFICFDDENFKLYNDLLSAD
ncbi:MAG: O-acetyl-ADP-ribose deacetylase [Sphingobacteriaceae bacterium]